MPTMDDVARRSGFSQMTVSRAFLESASIRKETRDRILSVAAEMGYYHNKAASSLASQRSRAFGIILPTLQDSIYLGFVDAARLVFESHRYDYILQTIDYARAREPYALGSLLSQRVQAILLPSIGHTPKTRKLLESLPVPLIEVGNLPASPIHFAVGHSDHEAGYLATRRLIEIGRRRIAIICGHVRTTSNARDRLNGYRQAMQEARLRPDDALCAEVEHSIDDGLNGLERLLASGRQFDGLVVGGEIWTAAVILRLLKLGRRIPDDVAVVGVGEVELGQYLPVPLTYVALPRREAGKRSAEMAVALTSGEDIDEAVVRLDVELVVNETA
ncbi:MAG TPA: LacI family DNA-binding transcriptional regulator [Bauldia sp.]|nr:LacI family DNA-binding transcriptional regulator [Bauldia sp.]